MATSTSNGKRAREERNDCSFYAPDLSTLAVYTYQGSLVTHFLPAARSRAESLAALIEAVFGSRRRTFSMTSSPDGDFLVMDEAMHRELFGGADSRQWSCLYIHEGSTEVHGAEISGALSTLCDRLARAHVPVLNMCTISRNFMLVRQEAAEVALQTLRATIEPPAEATADANQQQEASPRAAKAPSNRERVCAGVRIELLRGHVCIGMVSVAALKTAAHALLSLLFLQPSKGARGSRRPPLTHYFEMGGEVSLILDQSALDALVAEEAESASALLIAFGGTLSKGWRVLSVTAPAGSDGVGILSAVCLPLSSLPLLNVSTLDHTFVLVRESDVPQAIELLQRAEFAVERD